MGRRKLQRWINSHFLEQGVAMHHDAEIDPAMFSVQVHWRSHLERLFDNGNEDVLELIRTSQESFLLDGPEAKSEENGSRHEGSLMAMRFANIDSRIRPFLDKDWDRDGGQFITQVEALLLHFLKHDTVAPSIGEAVQRHLRCPPSIELRKNGSHLLVLPFDDAFRRLITHGVCQYYNLVSKSETQNDGFRPVHIFAGKGAARLQRRQVGLLSICLIGRALKRSCAPSQRSAPATRAGAGAGAGAGAAAGARPMPTAARIRVAAAPSKADVAADHHLVMAPHPPGAEQQFAEV